ncbi:MAG: HemX, putative uroporphyrinogen-III C-methyltransferase [Gammaproteobacteria bacterium]|jgi:uncharacterized protein HemX|nr:HemX, putative uroporphyrinogen-III C-methyltransferase [Gammaproteobacteria bacterium]
MSDFEQAKHFPVTIEAHSTVKGRKRASLSLLIAFAAFALSTYPFYQSYFHEKAPISQDNANAISQLQQSNQLLQAQVQQTQQTIAALQTAQQSMMALLQSTHGPQVTLHRLNFESARVTVQLAYALLSQRQDPVNISQQLDMAEDSLSLAGPSAQNILKQVQNLDTLVAGLPKLDPNTAIQQLDQLQQQLATLQFVSAVAAPSPEQISDNTPSQTALSGWKTGLQQSWQQLKSFLIIRSNNQIGPDLVANTSRFDAVRTLQLSIAEAKWDVVTGNPQYLNDLDQLQSQVQSFTTNNAAQQTWLNQLQALRAIPAVYPADKLQALTNSFQKVLSLFNHDLTH